MKVALYGKNAESLEKILLGKGVTVVDRHREDFDLLISYGGDGAMLGAELAYPQRLKMPVRDAMLAGKLKITKMMKLAGMTGNVKRYAVNDIFIHNMNNVSALRYQVKIDDDIYAREVVGDGVGVSTVHGSTAYYRSITHGSFRVGIGIAFSNSTELLNHLVLKEESVIKVRILRGPSELVFDNSPESVKLSEGDIVTIRKSEETAQMLGLEVFMCPECRRIRREQRAIGFEDIPL